MTSDAAGEPVFPERQRLGAVLEGIRDLARASGLDPASLPVPGPEAKPLDQPFMMAVIGEVNAGKSSLINALAGHVLCPVNVLPETREATLHVGAESSAHARALPGRQVTVHPDVSILREFTFVDTPGTNSGSPGTRESLTSVACHADEVIVVFPVSNPWEASTWDVLSDLSSMRSDGITLVLHKTDQCHPQDLIVIRGHLLDLAQKRLGMQPPVFETSTLESGKPGSTIGSLLWPHLIHSIRSHPGFSTSLARWRETAAAGLHRVDDSIDSQSRELNRKGRFLARIEEQAHTIHAGFLQRLDGRLEEVAANFRRHGGTLERKLWWRLGATASLIRLFRRDLTARRMEEQLIDRLEEAVREVGELDARELAEACLGHWSQVMAADDLPDGFDDGRIPKPHATLEKAAERFTLCLSRAATDGLQNLRIRNRLDKELRRRNLALRSFLATTLLLITIGASCGAMGIAWAPLILCSLAGLFLSGGIITAWITRTRTMEIFRTQLTEACLTFARTLHDDYSEAVRDIFQAYDAVYAPLREAIAEGDSAIKPLLRRWQELFLTLKSIEQDL